MKQGREGRRPGGKALWLMLLFLSLLAFSCKKEALAPRVETTVISDIGLYSFSVEGNLLETGDEGVSEHGFCWSLAPGAILETDSCIKLGPRLNTGTFSTEILNLSQNTTYYVRAFATNHVGTSYGKEMVVNTDRSLTVPRVQTANVSTISEYTAVIGGKVLDSGGSEITSYGVCWAESPGPDIDGEHISYNEGTGPFFTTIMNLELSTKYYVRAFAVNSTGLAYGEEVTFRTNHLPLTDIDGKVYPTVVIGEQVWMAKNLAVSRYADGSNVPFIPEDEWWDSLRVDEKGYCFYNNSSSNLAIYGALYSWEAAVNGQHSLGPGQQHIQGVCPDGWHLPSDEDWLELETHLGMPVEEAQSQGWRGNIGGKLKSGGREHWLIPNEGATNVSRFSALPAGDRFPNGEYFNLYYSTLFWTSTSYDEETAWARGLGYYVTTMYRGHEDAKNWGFSVRCVRNEKY